MRLCSFLHVLAVKIARSEGAFIAYWGGKWWSAAFKALCTGADCDNWFGMKKVICKLLTGEPACKMDINDVFKFIDQRCSWMVFTCTDEIKPTQILALCRHKKGTMCRRSSNLKNAESRLIRGVNTACLCTETTYHNQMVVGAGPCPCGSTSQNNGRIAFQLVPLDSPHGALPISVGLSSRR